MEGYNSQCGYDADLALFRTSMQPDYTRANVAQLDEFDCVIDVRSPAEYAEDHIPGAINCPVLDNEERIRVGTLYKQVSPFEARKVGAALVSRNIARHLEQTLNVHPKTWRPLIYCWRGGQRSGAFTHVLREIGWGARQLEGGYKAWRRHVMESLASFPQGMDFRVVAGPTGTGKSRVLEALAAQGAQVLHLEYLAEHKGSVLGDLPGTPQPSQKMFETRLYSALSGIDRTQPVFVEAESRQIGALRLPDALHEAMNRAACLRIDATREARVKFLLRDYHYLCDASRIDALLLRLKELQGAERVRHWQQLAHEGNFATLIDELLTQHYDPAYARSQRRHYLRFAQAPIYRATDLSPTAIESLAAHIMIGSRIDIGRRISMR